MAQPKQHMDGAVSPEFDLKIDRCGDPYQLITTREAADLLASSRMQVYRLMQAGKLPSIKIGSRRRLRRVDVENFILTHIYDSTEFDPTPIPMTKPDWVSKLGKMLG